MWAKSLNEKGGARTDTVIKLVLIFFISLLSFSVGTFVGKQFSDSQHKLAALESDFKGGEDEREERDLASIPPGNLDVKPEDALTDDDIAKLSEEFVEPKKDKEDLAKNEHGEKETDKVAHKESEKETDGETKDAGKKEAAKSSKKEVAKAEHEDTKQSEKIHAETAAQIQKVQKAAERVAQGHEPSEKVAVTRTEKRLPSSLPKEVASDMQGKFTIQVSSYKTEEEAKKRAEELKGKGFNAFYVAGKIGDVTWYRVSVGTFATLQEANTYKAKLMAEAKLTAAFVKAIVK